MKKLLIMVLISLVFLNIRIISFADFQVSQVIKDNYILAVDVMEEKEIIDKKSLLKEDYVQLEIMPWMYDGMGGEKYFRDFEELGITLLINNEGYSISYYKDSDRNMLHLYDYNKGKVSESTMDMGYYKDKLEEPEEDVVKSKELIPLLKNIGIRLGYLILAIS